MIALGSWLCGAALIAAGAALLWQRRTRAERGDAIRLVTSRYLGGKRFLTIVEVDGERLLLGLAGDHVSLVTKLGRQAPQGAELGAGGPGGVSPATDDCSARSARALDGAPAHAEDHA